MGMRTRRSGALAQLRREADALAAEDQDGALRVAHVPEVARCAGAEEERLAQLGQRGFEGPPVGPHAGLDARPVVEPGAAHLALVEREAQRLDQVELRARGQAGAPGVAGVPVDLGLDEDDVEHPGAGVPLHRPDRVIALRTRSGR